METVNLKESYKELADNSKPRMGVRGGEEMNSETTGKIHPSF